MADSVYYYAHGKMMAKTWRELLSKPEPIDAEGIIQHVIDIGGLEVKNELTQP